MDPVTIITWSAVVIAVALAGVALLFLGVAIRAAVEGYREERQARLQREHEKLHEPLTAEDFVAPKMHLDEPPDKPIINWK